MLYGLFKLPYVRWEREGEHRVVEAGAGWLWWIALIVAVLVLVF